MVVVVVVMLLLLLLLGGGGFGNLMGGRRACKYSVNAKITKPSVTYTYCPFELCIVGCITLKIS